MESLSARMQGVHRYILIRNEDRGRHFALSRRSVRRVPFLPHILRRGRQNVHVETQKVDFVLSFRKLKWDPPDGTAISRNAGGHRYILIRNED